MKVILLPLLLSSLTLLSPAGHASGAPGVSVGFSPEGSAEALVLGVIDRAQAEIRLAGYSFTSLMLPLLWSGQKRAALTFAWCLMKRRTRIAKARWSSTCFRRVTFLFG